VGGGAAGPPRCTKEWIDDLAAKVVGAERVIARRIDNLAPPSRPPAVPPAGQALKLRLACHYLAVTLPVEQSKEPAMNDRMDSLTRARERARAAKQRELAAHERAAPLQDQAAKLQARLGYHDRADQARQYAAAARERIALAHAEEAAWEAEVRAFDSQARTAPLASGEPVP
jgi:hypothetical protein